MRQVGDPMRSTAFEAASLEADRPGNALGPVERLDSPEQVRLELEIAGPMSRAFAYSIDYSLILLVMTIGFLIVVSGLQQIFEWAAEITFLQDLFERVSEWIADPEGSEDSKILRGIALSLGIWLLLDLFLTTTYFLLFETLWGGRTPGKRMTQIRVACVRGTSLGWRESVLRNLLRAVDMLPAGYLVGVLAIIFSPRGQRLGDLVAGTLVVRDRPSKSPVVLEEVVIDPEIEAGFRFTRDELAELGEIELKLIRRTLRRAEELSERAAGPILERAVQALTRRMGREELVPASLRRDFLRSLLQASERLL